MHFADPDGKQNSFFSPSTFHSKIILTLELDVKFEEFYDFFCTDVSNKTKNNLYDVYEKIRGDKE